MGAIPDEYKRASNGGAITLDLPLQYGGINYERVAVALASEVKQHAYWLARLDMRTEAYGLRVGQLYGYAWHVAFSGDDGHLSNGPLLDCGYDSARELETAMRAVHRALGALTYPRASGERVAFRVGNAMPVSDGVAQWYGLHALASHFGTGSRPTAWQWAMLRNGLAVAVAPAFADSPSISLAMDTPLAVETFRVWNGPRAHGTARVAELAARVIGGEL